MMTESNGPATTPSSARDVDEAAPSIGRLEEVGTESGGSEVPSRREDRPCPRQEGTTPRPRTQHARSSAATTTTTTAAAAATTTTRKKWWWCGRTRSKKTARLAILAAASLAGIVNVFLQHRRTGGVLFFLVQKQPAGQWATDALVALSSSTVTTTTSQRSAPDVVDVRADPDDDPLLAAQNLTANLPDWLVSYMDWHRNVKPTLTENNWDQHKYLVLRCLSWFPFCSGTSDRLRTFLFLLYLAQSDPDHEHRIFLIHWSRPAPLEAFLVPPPGGLDWRVPDWLLPKLELGNESHWKDVPWDEESLIQDYRIKSYYTVVEFSFIFQLHQLVDRLERQYRDCFNALFQPVPEIQQLVEQTQEELGLADTRYTAVHLRMKYTSIDRDDNNVWRALQCAARIGDPNSPIFVASDSGEMARRALEVAARRNLSRTVVARTDYHLYPSLHIDMGSDFLNPYGNDWKNHNASEYYTVFSDLLLLGGSSCVVAGTGSYGKWGSQLSKNVSCFGNYMTGEGC